MITKDEVEKYVSITKEVPDEIGLMKDGNYNTRYVSGYGVYVFCYLPKEVVKKLKSGIAEDQSKDGCHKLSYLTQRGNRFICNLNAGHDGLCLGATTEDEISAIFEPDDEAPDCDDYIANYVAEKIVHRILSRIMDD